jgi:C-terminal processing protease CtpA/Prc
MKNYYGMKTERFFRMNLILLLAISGFFLSGCEKDDNLFQNDTAARNELYNLMNEWYYWYEVMPQVNKEQYNDPYALLEAMRFLPDDRFSFVAPREYIEQTLEGKYIGYGFAHRKDAEGKERILYVYKDSPLWDYGVDRGYIITKVNGTTLNANSNLSQLLGANEIGVTNTLEFKSTSDTIFQVTVAKEEIQKNSVLLYDTLNLDGKIVGHLVYDEFIEPSYAEFDESFAFFNTTGVTEMIVDLRYNPGGLTDVLTYLANLMTGPSTDGELFLRYQHNNKKSNYNSDILFEQQANSLDISSVVFITSRGTASSSEALINCLKPYMDVKVVGDTTYGKPVGMYIFKYSDWAFLPIVFKIVNATGEGEYFSGIPPDRESEDDISRPFSDRKESCLSEAIYYLENGSFPPGIAMKTRYEPVQRPAYKDLLRRKYLK